MPTISYTNQSLTTESNGATKDSAAQDLNKSQIITKPEKSQVTEKHNATDNSEQGSSGQHIDTHV